MAVLGLADHDHVALGSKDLLQATSHHRMIVRNQNSQGGFP
jgi:hypothetical protein